MLNIHWNFSITFIPTNSECLGLRFTSLYADIYESYMLKRLKIFRLYWSNLEFKSFVFQSIYFPAYFPCPPSEHFHIFHLDHPIETRRFTFFHLCTINVFKQIVFL